jgi:hypothetical protein
MNKDLYEVFGCDPESIYDIVRNQEWTLDKFYEILVGGEGYPYTSTYIDLTGNRKRDTRDTYGFISWDYWGPMQGFLTGADPGYITRDEDGYPVISLYNEKTLKMQEMLIKIFNANETGVGRLYNNESAKASKAFFEGRGLFFGGQTLGALEAAEFASSEINFAVLPFPKLDEDQEEYYSRVVNFSSLTYIPVTNQKLELTSAVLEYMAYLSNRDLIPAFYDEILTIKTSRDIETEEMIDIVRNGSRFLDENYLGSGTIINIIASGQNTLSSNYASQGDAWELKLMDIIDFWEK